MQCNYIPIKHSVQNFKACKQIKWLFSQRVNILFFLVYNGFPTNWITEDQLKIELTNSSQEIIDWVSFKSEEYIAFCKYYLSWIKVICPWIKSYLPLTKNQFFSSGNASHLCIDFEWYFLQDLAVFPGHYVLLCYYSSIIKRKLSKPYQRFVTWYFIRSTTWILQ